MKNSPPNFNRTFAGGNPVRRALDRSSLPAPVKYLFERGLLKKKPRGEWVSIPCPVHKAGAEKTPSMRISLVDGHYKCMACGAKGGDIVSLHRLITGASFPEAVRDLGARFDD